MNLRRTRVADAIASQSEGRMGPSSVLEDDSEKSYRLPYRKDLRIVDAYREMG